MTDAEKYPGLYEAFKEWHLSHCGDRVEWHDRWVSHDYCNFVAGHTDGGMFYSTKGNEEFHKYPPYLIALRDMSLV